MKLKLLPLVLMALTTMVLAGAYPPGYTAAPLSKMEMYAPEQPSFLGPCVIDSENPMYRIANERCSSDEVLIYDTCVPHIDPNTGETYGLWDEQSKVCSAMKAGLVCWNNKCGEGQMFTGIYYYLIPLVVVLLIIGAAYYGYKKYKAYKGGKR